MTLKKLFAGLISLAAALFAVCAISVCAGAETYESGDCKYVVENDGTITITGCVDGTTNLTIPSNIDGKKVTSVGGWSFVHNSDITSVTISDNVTTIGEFAFAGCPNISSIKIPESVVSIGASAFSGCSSLTSITIPSKVTSISDGTFSGCEGLISIKLPDAVTSIGPSAFDDCSSLMSIKIPDSVTSIGLRAFRLCESLTSITIPDGVTSISSSTFENCTNLVSVSIPDSVISIEDCAFLRCPSIISIKLPDSVMSIGDQAFRYCTNLSSVNIPDGVTVIQYDTFESCEKLASIKIPDSVVKIGDEAFKNCVCLTSVVIPKNVTSISLGTFANCSNITSITVPDSVQSIGVNAFDGCKSLTSVRIPDGVISIPEAAFNKCSSLPSINIPDSVTRIDYNAFCDCSSLKSIDIPDSVISIDLYAFKGCINLSSMTVDKNNQIYTSIDGVVLNKDMTEVILCPEGKKGEFVIPDSVTSVNDRAFEYCKHITAITMPDSVTNIGFCSFSGCDDLKDVYYSGTKAQWDEFPRDIVNSSLFDANIHYGKHISADPIRENEVEATCGEEGSYDEVVYCSDCGEELSRKTVTVPAIGKHTPAESVKENEVEATCGADGSYDEVVYCSVCGEELSRKTEAVPATGKHTPAESVKENEVEATCGADGSYDEVVYCSVCKAQISRTPVTVPATGEHTYVDKVVAPTYTAQGYTEHTCSVCGYSYKDTYTAKKTVPAVTGLKLKARAADALRISWTKNTSADGYIIEMKSGNSWTRVGKITSNSTVEFKKSKLKAGTAYTFRIKAYKMDGKTAFYSSYTTISARTNPSVVSGLKLKARAADALRLTWTKNDSADGYIIEMKDGSKWVRVGKITKNSTIELKKSKLKAGTAYTFRIKAYKMSGKTALYGATKTISVRTNPSATASLKLKNSAKNAVRLSWNKNTSADGYIVEMKVNGVWKRAGKISKNSTVEFKKSGLKSKTSYSFRVKAYKMSGKTALYGATKTITVKTK